ncbi:hypothetical protein EXS57_00305 [Candidatus Kaiserbacteria bacterium]|nr:hypothetical protein [Candidatus Kaiserbacteria bacterium]
MTPPLEDETSSLEHAREHLYKATKESHPHPLLTDPEKRELPHTWEQEHASVLPLHKVRHVRFAGIFFIVALLFFIIATSVAGYIFFIGGNSVSVDKITVDVIGPKTIAGGDVVPLSLTITNRNSVAIENVVIEIEFPNGTRDAVDMMKAYPRYIENVGKIAPGESVTRSVKAVVFGGAGQTLTLPISFYYNTPNSGSTFIKNSSYTLVISTTPLSVAVDALAETVSDQPITFTLTVSSNATIPLENVVLTGAFPFGFVVTSSSRPLSNSSFLLGTLASGASVKVRLTGKLTGQDNEQRVFHFTVGTAKTAQDQALAVTYMTQDATVTIAAPFINTVLALNGETSSAVVMLPDAPQNVSLSYSNTLPTSITDAIISVTVSGAAIDFNSIRTQNGFYNSVNHSVIFSKDTDPALMLLAPGASGIGSFTFRTLPASALVSSPTVTFTTSVLGTRVGQANVLGKVSASTIKTAKVATRVVLSAAALHSSGSLRNSGPIPPRIDEATTYTVVFNVENKGSAVAGGIVSAVLPNYISYTDLTSGAGTFSYNDASHTVSWDIGDLVQGARAQGSFQVSLTPSFSQKGTIVPLTRTTSFSGYDRFAGVQISSSADSVTTETIGDPGYKAMDGGVQ